MILRLITVFTAMVASTVSAIGSDIPDGRLGFPLGKYLEIEGIRAEEGKVGVNTLLVQKIDGKDLKEPIGVWIENVKALPPGEKIVLRGYESGKMIGLPHEVAVKENLSVPQADWQFYRYFIVTTIIQPSTLNKEKG